jgi:DNA-binding CsgD family transcriptional regulator
MEETSCQAVEESVSLVLRPAIGLLCETLDPQAAFAATRDACGGYVIGERYGLHDPRWDGVIVKPGRGLGGRVVEERRPVAVEDYFQDPSITGDFRPIVKADHLRSISCVPVLVNRRAEALLWVAVREGESLGARFVDQTLRVAEMAAGCLSHIQSRAALAAEARRALRLDEPASLRAVVQKMSEFHQGSTQGYDLTERQTEVLDLLSMGLSNAQLALRLGIAETTAKEHVRDLGRKLGTASRFEAVARAREVGLI